MINKGVSNRLDQQQPIFPAIHSDKEGDCKEKQPDCAVFIRQSEEVSNQKGNRYV
jgi:hypothetical protein